MQNVADNKGEWDVAVDLLYTVDKDCALCGRSFPVTKVRNRLRMVKQDTDFCTTYADINPYYYDIWVCPHCGYAAQESWFSELSESAAVKVKAFLKGKDIRVDFGGERSCQQALDTYRLALYFANLTGQIASRVAGLFLRTAWLFRESGEADKEQVALTEARKYYEEALMKEPLPIGHMSEISLEYIVAELYRRTGELDKAMSGFGRIVGNPKAKLEKRVLEMARDAWHATRDLRDGKTKDEDENPDLLTP